MENSELSSLMETKLIFLLVTIEEFLKELIIVEYQNNEIEKNVNIIL